MASVRIGDGIVTVEDTAQSSRDGRPVYAWDVVVTGANERWHASDLYGPVCGPEPTEEEMLRTLFSFLSAALESRSYRERTGRGGENEDLFPADMLDWAESHSDEISMLSMGPSEMEAD